MYNIRNAIPDDYNFIKSTLKSAELYDTNRDEMFSLLLKCSDLYVLTPKEHDNLIIGTCIVCDDKLVWIYIKEIYRRMGIATYMLDLCDARTEFLLKGSGDAWKSLVKRNKLKWNPYLLLPTLNYINL